MAKKLSIYHWGFIYKFVYYNPDHSNLEVCKDITQNWFGTSKKERDF